MAKENKAIHWILSQTFTSPMNCFCCWLGFKEKKSFLRKLSSAKRSYTELEYLFRLVLQELQFLYKFLIWKHLNSSSLHTDLRAAACLLLCVRIASHPAAGDTAPSWLASLWKHQTCDSLKEFWTICCIGALVKPTIGRLWRLFRSSIATVQRDFWGTNTDNWV